MNAVVWLALAGVALAALYFAALRAITIAELAIEGGAVRVVKGRIAAPVLADVRDVARTPRIARVKVRILRSSGRAEVRFSGGEVSAAQAQRIRNVIGSVPLARLVNSR